MDSENNQVQLLIRNPIAVIEVKQLRILCSVQPSRVSGIQRPPTPFIL